MHKEDDFGKPRGVANRVFNRSKQRAVFKILPAFLFASCRFTERSVASRECATKADALTHLFEWWCNFNDKGVGDERDTCIHDVECVGNIAKCMSVCVTLSHGVTTPTCNENFEAISLIRI